MRALEPSAHQPTRINDNRKLRDIPEGNDCDWCLIQVAILGESGVDKRAPVNHDLGDDVLS